MKVVTDDLLALALDGRFDVIVHGANCQCTMGSGIAKEIRSVLPEAYQADLRTERGSRKKLGTISTAEIVRGAARFTVVNAYTQYGYGGGRRHVDYDALRSAFEHVKKAFTGKRIGYPKIGAGLGGGDWGRIAAIIDEVLAGENHTLVLLKGA